MPSCPSLWATMIWAGHPPTCVQWADEDTSGSRDRDKSNGKCILHHCNSCQISEFSVKDRAKFLQHCHRLLQGHMDTLEHQGRSEQEEGQCPTLCLDWIGSALEIFQCCSSFVLLKNRATELGASPLLAQPHGLWDPPQFLTQHHIVLWSCLHSRVLSLGSCSQGGESPILQCGSWASGRGALSPKKGAWALLKMQICFLKCFMPKDNFTTCL